MKPEEKREEAVNSTDNARASLRSTQQLVDELYKFWDKRCKLLKAKRKKK